MADTDKNPLIERSVFHIARIVVETLTPLSIAAGAADGVHDNLLVRDANGLPTIPGSSFAGVLRHLYADVYTEDEADALFGVARLGGDVDSESPSLVHTSWGCIHDSQDIPVQGLLDPDAGWKTDAALKDALQAIPVKRDHVKLTEKGVASTKGMAKFDRVSLTAGHRFSLELSLWSDPNNDQSVDPRWSKLLNLLAHHGFRLGGKTRSGLGKLAIERCFEGVFPLDAESGEESTKGLEGFQNLGQDLANVTGLVDYKDKLSSSRSALQMQVSLTPEAGGFRIGSGTQTLDPKSDADMVTITEQRLQWSPANKASLKDREILIPASGIKGALRHRTAYYYLLLKRKADPDSNNDEVLKSGIDQIPTITELFGFTAQDDNGITITRPGKVLIDDVYLPVKPGNTMTLAHNSIDRFTGGVRNHMLYFEEVVTQKDSFDFYLTIVNDKDKEKIDVDIIKALEMAVTDLGKGRLALGAGSGRSGTGYFSGNWHYLDKEAEKQEVVA